MSIPKLSPATLRTAPALSRVGPSAISRMMAAAAALAREGRDIVGLHVGEPDFPTPDHVIEAAIRAMRAGETHYTALDGTPALKRAIQAKFARDNGLDVAPGEILVAPGAKMLLFLAFLATLHPDDEVIIPAPYWTSYPEIVAIMGGRPVIVPTRAADGCRLQAADLARAITPRTRWVLLNSPSNPSGAVYEAAQYAQLLEVLARHPSVWLIADDIYEHILFDGARFATPAQLRPDLRDRILTVNGVSKAYAMTGWRIGYAAGPVPLIRAMAALQSHSTHCACSIAQAAAAAALAGPQKVVAANLAEYAARRDLVLEAVRGIPGLTCAVPGGAFYAFIGWDAWQGATTPGGALLADDEAFCGYLLQEAGLAVVPGAAFGAPGHMRLSFASDRPVLAEGMRRLRVAIGALRRAAG